MGALERIPGQPVPPAAISRVLARFDRPALEGFIAVALDLLDFADGDADEEEVGDETDGKFAEDEPAAHFATMSNGPGDLYADDDSEHDGRENDDGI
jgi:hypothetical protein